MKKNRRRKNSFSKFMVIPVLVILVFAGWFFINYKAQIIRALSGGGVEGISYSVIGEKKISEQELFLSKGVACRNISYHCVGNCVPNLASAFCRCMTGNWSANGLCEVNGLFVDEVVFYKNTSVGWAE